MVAVKLGFIIGLIIQEGSENERILYPFLDCTHTNIAEEYDCVRLKVSMYNNDEIFPLTEEENNSFRFFQPLEPEHNVLIAQLRDR